MNCCSNIRLMIRDFKKILANGENFSLSKNVIIGQSVFDFSARVFRTTAKTGAAS